MIVVPRQGIDLRPVIEGGDIVVELGERVLGRVLQQDLEGEKGKILIETRNPDRGV